MSTKNLIKKENKFTKEYLAKVVSNDDPLRRGRLLVTQDTLMGKIAFWTNCTNQIGKVNFQLIPEPEDTVTIKFKNKDIYSGEWELKGSPIDGTDEKNIDPKKYGLYDANGNCIIIDRSSNDIAITAMNDYNVTVKNCMNIIIEKDANLTISGNVTQMIQGNVDETISGSVTQKISGTTDITCPTTNITGNLHVTGTIISDTEVTNSLKQVNLGTHVHPYSWTDGPGAGNTSPGQN